MTAQAQHRAEVLEEMLLDAGLSQDAELRRALVSLGSFADLPIPDPGPELAALLAPPVDQLDRRRKLRRHRTTVVGIAFAAGMGLGATGVAASSAPSGGTGSPSVQHLLEDWMPSWSIAPSPSFGAADSRPPAGEPSPEPSALQGDSGLPEPDPTIEHEEPAMPDGGAAAGKVPDSGAARQQKSSSGEEPGKAPEHAAQEAAVRRSPGGGAGQSSPRAPQTPASAAHAGEAAKSATKNGAAPGDDPVLPWLKKADR
ncbi:hypothetical protein [Pseudarthrobacter sp. NamE5]|uniref:hypothetical protein n=1 Tax=Pseudarthrobacter sp. NamE5 TaxID=2576839 RepID=UPI00110B25FA|nr:hypothetical protein [Pseudarthrobacter sp. NamE5]TLM87105.1 hypothetical protein FDW84_04665 [Pseudarthrobacter sp. NamE5]